MNMSHEDVIMSSCSHQALLKSKPCEDFLKVRRMWDVDDVDLKPAARRSKHQAGHWKNKLEELVKVGPGAGPAGLAAMNRSSPSIS